MRIACMGSAPSSVRLGPYMDATHAEFQGGKVQAYPPALHHNERWQIWGCSPGLFGVAPRADRWFELHRWEPGQAWFSPEYCQFLRDFKGPVYCGGKVEEVANCVVYPKQDVEAEFSAFFLNSSLSLMAALAIMDVEQTRKARAVYRAGNTAQAQAMLPKWVDPAELQALDKDDVIGFWGVDMSATEEYARQKPGCWFFGLEIVRRGIGLFYPPESDLFCPEPIYGICEWDPEYIKATARAREINSRVTANQQQIQALQNQTMADMGASSDMSYWIKTFMSPYRLPAGVVIHQEPGSGLGVSVATIDGVPVVPAKPELLDQAEYTGRTEKPAVNVEFKPAFKVPAKRNTRKRK